MSKFTINEQIIKWIRKNCDSDKDIEEFLLNLIYFEAERTGQWQWKDNYKRMIKNHSNEWGNKNEN